MDTGSCRDREGLRILTAQYQDMCGILSILSSTLVIRTLPQSPYFQAQSNYKQLRRKDQAIDGIVVC